MIALLRVEVWRGGVFIKAKSVPNANVAKVSPAGGGRVPCPAGLPAHRNGTCGMSARIVTVTPTIMDGTVVRWYGSLEAAENPAICGILSVSRNGVMGGGGYITEADWSAAAAVYAQLICNPRADLRHLATHRTKGLRGPLVPVTS